jgi:uncharacterized protein (TIGR00369 family)
MPLHEHDESWPYVEQFSSIQPADQEIRLGRLPALQNMELRLEEFDKDYTMLSISPPGGVRQPKGVWQGGVLASLVDATARQALRTTLKSGHDAVTVHLDTKYFRPVADQRVYAEGSVVRKGRNLAHIDVAVLQEGGALVARGWCVLKLLRPAAAQPPAELPPPADVPPPTPDCGMVENGLGI